MCGLTQCLQIQFLVAFLAVPSLLLSEEITKDVVREGKVVFIKPCDLRFNLPEGWQPPPKGVANFPNQQGFMFGKMGLKDQEGRDVIPTLTVLWQTIEIAGADGKEAQGTEPLMAYITKNRPDAQSRECKVEKIFNWQSGPLALRNAMGWQFGATLRGRASKVIVIYTINREKKLGVQIAAEVPEEVLPKLKEELDGIFKSFATAP